MIDRKVGDKPIHFETSIGKLSLLSADFIRLFVKFFFLVLNQDTRNL